VVAALLKLKTAVFVVLLGRLEQVTQDERPSPRAIWPLLSMVATCAALGVLADLGTAADGGTVRW